MSVSVLGEESDKPVAVTCSPHVLQLSELLAVVSSAPPIPMEKTPFLFPEEPGN